MKNIVNLSKFDVKSMSLNFVEYLKQFKNLKFELTDCQQQHLGLKNYQKQEKIVVYKKEFFDEKLFGKYLFDLLNMLNEKNIFLLPKMLFSCNTPYFTTNKSAESQ